MAPLIENQLQLESLIAQVGPTLQGPRRTQMQRACFDRIRPFLKFRPEPIQFLFQPEAGSTTL